jgi:hypothetical protein
MGRHAIRRPKTIIVEIAGLNRYASDVMLLNRQCDRQTEGFLPTSRLSRPSVGNTSITRKGIHSMKRDLFVLALWLGLAAASLAFARQALATLGEPAASVARDRQAIAATRRATTTTRTRYTVQEIVSDVNTVREYIAPSGIVFAIAWNGVTQPDLTTLLGSYAEEYRQAARQAPRHQGRRSSQVKTDRVVVEKWGHMRNMQGRAYDPALIPPGVNIDEIK